jgi:hypothetical protein
VEHLVPAVADGFRMVPRRVLEEGRHALEIRRVETRAVSEEQARDAILGLSSLARRSS